MRKQKQYLAQLQAQANVPEDRSLQLDLNYSIEFRILCPKNGCETIKKDGIDKNHSKKPQKFECKNHGVFYAHTSWVIQQLTQVIIMRILSSLFAGKKPANSLAKEFRMSDSTISKLIHHCQNYVDYVIESIKELEQGVQTQISDDGSGIIWLDEIFFKVGKNSFALILAINNRYQIAGWKLGKTRKADDIIEVLQQVDDKQNWNILIGDGSKAYPKALRERGKDCYFIRHKHSHPWELAEIHKYEVLPDKSMVHSIIELRYDALVKAVEKPQLGYALEKTYYPKKEGKTRGRPKGSKNKKKKRNKADKQKQPKKRGPKTPKSHGKAIILDLREDQVQVSFQDSEITINHSRKDNPAVPTLTTMHDMIHTAIKACNGGYMVSNLIESKNSLIRHIMPDRGMKTKYHLKNQLVPRLKYYSGGSNGVVSMVGTKEIALPIRVSLGFFNLDKFFVPKLENLRIMSTVGGN